MIHLTLNDDEAHLLYEMVHHKMLVLPSELWRLGAELQAKIDVSTEEIRRERVAQAKPTPAD